MRIQVVWVVREPHTKTKRRHVLEDLNPRWHCRENLTSRGLYVKTPVWMPLCFNPLALELDIYSLAHHLCKM